MSRYNEVHTGGSRFIMGPMTSVVLRRTAYIATLMKLDSGVSPVCNGTVSYIGLCDDNRQAGVWDIPDQSRRFRYGGNSVQYLTTQLTRHIIQLWRFTNQLCRWYIRPSMN